MTVRLVVRFDDAAMAANVGGSVYTWIQSFDIEHPELEAALRNGANMHYGHGCLVGAELIPPVGKEKP